MKTKKEFTEMTKVLRKIRKTNKLTQEDMAKLIGTKTQQYSAMERGVAHTPIKYMRIFSDKLNIPKIEFSSAYSMDAISNFNKEFHNAY